MKKAKISVIINSQFFMRLKNFLIFFLITSIVSSLKIKAQNPDSLKAEQILNKYVEAMGGIKAFDKIQNRVSKNTIEIPSQSLQIDVTIIQAKPDKFYTILESSATGKRETGSNGEVVWENSTIAGPQIIEGKALDNAKHLYIFDRFIYWQKAYKDIKLVGFENVNDKPCYKIIATPEKANQQTLYFDKESYLLTKVEMNIESLQGSIPIESYFSDYKEIDGIKISHKNKIILMDQERITTVNSVEHNVNLPENRFDLPSEIKEILQKK